MPGVMTRQHDELFANIQYCAMACTSPRPRAKIIDTILWDLKTVFASPIKIEASNVLVSTARSTFS